MHIFNKAFRVLKHNEAFHIELHGVTRPVKKCSIFLFNGQFLNLYRIFGYLCYNKNNPL